jgi:hypothetical protein
MVSSLVLTKVMAIWWKTIYTSLLSFKDLFVVTNYSENLLKTFIY